MTTRQPLLAAVALSALLVGCGGMTANSGRTFTLVSIDQETVPTGPGLVGARTMSGGFLLGDDGSCERTHMFAMEGRAEARMATWACTWETTDSELRVTWAATGELPMNSPEGQSVGALEGDRLTLMISTGIVCVTTPCPSGFTEFYERTDP